MFLLTRHKVRVFSLNMRRFSSTANPSHRILRFCLGLPDWVKKRPFVEGTAEIPPLFRAPIPEVMARRLMVSHRPFFAFQTL